jgi:hypothetical protein
MTIVSEEDFATLVEQIDELYKLMLAIYPSKLSGKEFAYFIQTREIVLSLKQLLRSYR